MIWAFFEKVHWNNQGSALEKTFFSCATTSSGKSYLSTKWRKKAKRAHTINKGQLCLVGWFAKTKFSFFFFFSLHNVSPLLSQSWKCDTTLFSLHFFFIFIFVCIFNFLVQNLLQVVRNNPKQIIYLFFFLLKFL